MSLTLKKGIEVLAGAALTMVLAALMLALFPTVAEAETKAKTETQITSSIVVRPGDSLWSITSEQLGSNARPQQIANGVERIYAHNRGRIGADPNLIFPGQKLSLPPVGEPPRGNPRTGSTPKREAPEPVAASPTARGEIGETERASSTTVGEVGSKARQAPDSVTKPVGAKPVALPEMPAKQVKPNVGALSSPELLSSVEPFARTAHSHLSIATSAVIELFPQDDHLLGRRLLGLGIIVLTLLVAVLVVWKLPMKRPLDAFEVWPEPVTYAAAYDNPPPQKSVHHSGGKPEPMPLTSEWELSAELKASLLTIPLGRPIPQETLEEVRYQVDVALEELAWLDDRRGLFNSERQLQTALVGLLEALSAMDKAPG